MRWMIRILLTWAILMPLGYYVGLPQAAAYLQTKTKAETMTQCGEQLKNQQLVGTPNAPLNAEQGDLYCHCLADKLTFTRDDILGIVQDMIKTGNRQPPARLTAQIKEQVGACNSTLQNAILEKYQGSRPAATTTGAPASSGSETLIFK